MFGSLGLPELLFIFALALVIFGPKRLPQVGRTVGRGLAEFRKASTDLRRTINAELIDEDLKSADPRKIVRDSLRDMKKGLDGDLRAATGTKAGPRRDEPEAHDKTGAAAEDSTTGGGSSESVSSSEQGPESQEPSSEPEPPIVAAKGAVPRGPKPSSRPLESELKKSDPSESDPSESSRASGDEAKDSLRDKGSSDPSSGSSP